MTQRLEKKFWLSLTLVGGAGLFGALGVNAQFSLNFVPLEGTVDRFVVQGANGDTDAITPGQTPFLWNGTTFERVTDPTTGKEYYHMIVGSLADGFIQESYIEMNSIPGLMSFSGPTDGDNSRDPLGTYFSNETTGNGHANPREVILRQVVNDGQIMMEFKKDKLLYKPIITQTLRSPDIVAVVQIDMRNSTYDDTTTPGTIINIQRFADEFLDDVASFDLSKDGHEVDVSAGRYKFIDGLGSGGTRGTYEYVDGGFDLEGIQWEDFFDYTADNPWSYPDLKPSR